MTFEVSKLNDDPAIQDFLARVGAVFKVGLEIEANGSGAVYRSFTDEKTGKLPVFSATLSQGGPVPVRLNIYHHNAGQDILSAVEKLIREKLEDYGDVQNLTQELLVNYDKLNMYRSLAEQILQPEHSAESYDTLLAGLELLIHAGKCGIIAVGDNPAVGEMVACRKEGKTQPPVPTKYALMGTPFERAAREMRSLMLMETVAETVHASAGGVDIVLKGPLLVAPLLYRKPPASPRVVGFLFALSPTEGSFNEVDQHAIATISSLASIAMKHFEALETARRATFEMDTMLKDLMSTFESLQLQSALVEQVNRISIRINSTLDLDMIFNSIADYTRSLLNGECSLVAVMSGAGRVTFPGAAGIERDTLPRAVVPEQECILSLCFASEKPIIENHYDPSKCLLGFNIPLAIRNFVTYPIQSLGKTAAVIMVFNKGEGQPFTVADSDFLKALAYQATTAIENARLLNDLKQTQFTMMAKLSELAEKRDPETGEHLLRMQKYSRIIAQELSKTPKHAHQIDEHFINQLYAAAPLHDIGKVAITDGVLLKRGKLTPEEWDVMKTHAEVGEMILRGPDYLKVAAEIAGYHHEKYDGSGYPHGAKGEDIPLVARIVAVADVYDALTSRRVYKEDMSHEVAMDIINRDTGKHFDPEVVNALKAGMREILTIKNLIR
ncbi:MAG: HD domain-containing protein [Nitrospinae bacterium]|nr:HD domain-containing protein [Nitrospinota bacterium]